MTAQFARTPYRGRSGGSSAAEPHAALLIDFDNVTMGIRSDLTKELKNLLNSDIIKGKVAVQRAYADWRRYPQYIVPLAESSVDLIFAPAYGSAKKNATDIRLAIDAIELVFTRAEIGTIILLSGDSDFSSLVLKLKEYGKYVIGVGIRESASDLLVQNCDEYYSYSALTGLTRAGDEAPVVSEDPWELVELALKQMIDNDDVMRSDRLKQVLLEMDPNFDEKALGFQKFNKFVQEAATRGILGLRKQENGQFEVGPPIEGGAPPAEATASEGRERSRSRGRRGRGRRDEGRTREERKDQIELGEPEEAEAGGAAPEAAAAPAAAAGSAVPEAAAPRATSSKAAASEVDAEASAGEADVEGAAPSPAKRRRAPRKRGGAAKQAAEAAAASEAEPEAPQAAAASAAEKPSTPTAAPDAGKPAAGETGGKGGGDLAASYDLLRRATAELVRKNGPAVRDSDVKRRMLELQTGWDESAHGFSKFSRFLRQAHDAEVVTLRQADGGNYEVMLGSGEASLDDGRDAGGGRRDRGRGRGRSEGTERSAPRSSQVSEPAREEKQPAAAASTASGATQATSAARSEAAKAPAQAAAASSTGAAPSDGPTQTAAQTAAQKAIGFRRGSRGRAAPSGPPPLLEGQTARVSSAAAAKSDAAAAGSGGGPTAAQGSARKSPAGKAPAKKSGAKKSGAKKSAKKVTAAKSTSAPSKRSAAKTPAKAAKPAADSPRKGAAKSTRGGRVDAAALGLPTDAGEIANYITAYKGVGPKSVQSLIGRFGASHVFDALETQADDVRDLLGARAETLLEAWTDDVAARRAGMKDTSAGPSQSPGAAKKSRTRRGGRRSRKGQTADT